MFAWSVSLISSALRGQRRTEEVKEGENKGGEKIKGREGAADETSGFQRYEG